MAKGFLNGYTHSNWKEKAKTPGKLRVQDEAQRAKDRHEGAPDISSDSSHLRTTVQISLALWCFKHLIYDYVEIGKSAIFSVHWSQTLCYVIVS